MNNRTPKACLLTLLVVVLIPVFSMAENSITLDTVMGDQFRDGKIMYDHSGEVVFVLRITVDSGIAGHITDYRNGFHCYTTGTVTHSWFLPEHLPAFPAEEFDGMAHVGCDPPYGWAWFNGFTIFGDGVPPGYNERAFALSVSITDADPSTNPTFCFDSLDQYPPTNEWGWDDEYNDIRPTWDGPHCFEIVRCCDGMTGNINDDPNDNVDISDLTAMINYLFGPHIPIPCVDEADVTGDGTVDISDVVYFAKFLFLLGAPPAPCF